LSLTSDPHAWLRPFYAKLQADHAFHHLSPSHQFEQLCAAVAVDHPAEAAKMREWSDGGQRALLVHLADSKPINTPALTELWRVSKANRELRCVVQYLTSGIDLRLLEGDGFRKTQLCRDATEADALSAKWRHALLERGWTAP
jgi:hypothetical protein